MSRYLFVLAIWPGLVRGLLRPLLRCRGRATQLRVARGPDRGDSFQTPNGRGDETQQRGGSPKKADDDPYAFLADADLAASYSEKDSWTDGAATLLVGVDLPGAALDFDASISELSELAKGAGLHIVGPPLRRRLRQPDP